MTKRVDVNVFYPTHPHEKQQEVLDDPSRFKIVRAGRKWRKSSLGVSWLFEKALKNECGVKGCTSTHSYFYVAPTRKQAKDIVWLDHVERLLGHLEKQGVKFKRNEHDLSVTFAHNKARIQLAGVDNPDALRGVSIWGGIVLDEYDDFKEDIFPLVIRPNLLPHKTPVYILGTPKGKSLLYRMSNNVYHDGPQKGEKIWKSFHFTTFDNPDLDKTELDAVVSEFKSYGDAYYKQEIMAEYVKPVGIVYDEFDEQKQYLDTVAYDPNLPLHCTWDFGVKDPTAIIWIQPGPDGEVRVIDCHEESNANIEHFAQIINSKPYKTPSLHTGDIAGRARSLQTGKSVIDELKKLGIYVTTNPIPDIPTQIRKTHQIIPRLRVAKPRCEHFLDCLSNYRYPEEVGKESTTEKAAETPLHNWASHMVRALEYWSWNIGYTTAEVDDTMELRSVELRKDGFYI